MIRNVFLKKQIRVIINFDFIFYKNYNLLMYLKFVISTIKIIEIDDKFLSFNESFNKSDDVDNINNLISSFR